MKKIQKICTLLMCLLLVASLAAPALAAESNVSFDGNAKDFIFKPGSKESLTDLFVDLKNIMPGDKLSQSIAVKNDSDMEVKIYLRALGAVEDSEKFLSQLKLTVKQESIFLFGATAEKTAQLTDWVCLGSFQPGDKVNLAVTLEVPIEMGNEFQHAAGLLDWQFRVDEIVPETTEPSVPETSAPTEPSVPETSAPTEPSVPETSAPTEPSVPETSAPTEPSVPETSAPTEPSAPETSAPTESPQPTQPEDSNNPTTGDESNILLYSGLMLFSLTSLSVLLFLYKRNKKQV